MKYLIALLLVLLVACASEQAPTPPAVPPSSPSVPAAQTAPAQDSDGTQIVESGTDKTFGEVEKRTALDIDEVVCDKEERSLSFRFQNDDVKTWQMNQQIPFPAPKDLDAVRVYINSYEVNGRNPYIKDRV